MKILNYGSLNIDFVYSVEHFVRPGETISSSMLEKFCGGKGLNQSAALAKAGAETYHAGKIGSDGLMLKKQLESCGVDTGYITVADMPSGHAIIQVDAKGQNCIMLFGGANQAIETAEIDHVLKHFSNGDILLLQNEINNLPYLMAKAKEAGMQIALNPSPMDEKLLSCPLENVDYFILNEIEGKEITGRENAEEIADTLLKKYPGCKVVLTLGKAGVLYKDEIQSHRHGIYDVPVVDTTAAGDTFTGFFLAGIASGLDVPQALRNASVASSLAVSQKGASVSIPTLQQVEKAELKPL